MKPIIAINLFAMVAAASPLVAQSLFDKDLELLRAQREKALATAAEPINRRYQTLLEQLIERATQAKDLETALKAKEELALFVAGGAAGMPITSSSSPTGKGGKGGSDLSGKLPGITWVWGNQPSAKFTFLANGRFDGHFKKASWRALGSDFVYYEWDDKAFTGIMRISKGMDRLDATEWQTGKTTPYNIVATKASK